MKHKLPITLLILGMFLVTQFIGLLVISEYTPIKQEIVNPQTGQTELIILEQNLPFGLQPPKDERTPTFLSLIFSFALAFAIIFMLIKYNWKFVIKAWFFLIITLALGITINAFLKNYLATAAILSIIISLPLAYLKIFKPNFWIHNSTELLIYPGIAAVFVPILTPFSIIGLLILISIYDMWAVWKSGIMQKMAKFQMEELKIFGGFLVPSISKGVRLQIKKIKQKYKGKKIPKKIKNKKFRVKFAILGGGDIIFPIITAGVLMRYYNIIPAIFVIFGALIGLGGLFLITKKGKAYPAMPYITAGIFMGLIIWKYFFSIS